MVIGLGWICRLLLWFGWFVWFEWVEMGIVDVLNIEGVCGFVF